MKASHFHQFINIYRMNSASALAPYFFIRFKGRNYEKSNERGNGELGGNTIIIKTRQNKTKQMIKSELFLCDAL